MQSVYSIRLIQQRLPFGIGHWSDEIRDGFAERLLDRGKGREALLHGTGIYRHQSSDDVTVRGRQASCGETGLVR